MTKRSFKNMAPKTKEQFEEIRQRSMASIRQAALELFAHQGYHSTSISNIAKEAGISKGLMYNYFANKEALLIAIIEDAVAIGDHLIHDALQFPGSGFEKIEFLTRRTMELMQRNFHYWKLLLSLAFQPDAQAALVPIVKHKEVETMQKTVIIFEEMGVEKPMQEMMFYGAMLDGIMIQYMQITEGYPLEEMVEMVIDRYRPYA